MSVEYESSGKLDTDGAAASSLTIANVVLTGSGRNIVVSPAITSSSAPTVSSISRGSDTYTQRATQYNRPTFTRVRQDMWNSSNEPQAASADLTVTLSASTDHWGFTFANCTGVDQTTRMGTPILNSDENTPACASSISVTSAVGDMVVSICAERTAEISETMCNTETMREHWISGVNVIGQILATAPGAASVTCSFQNVFPSGQIMVHQAANLNASSGSVIDASVAMSTNAGLTPQAQMTIGAGVLLTTSADMVDQNQSVMDLSMLLSAATAQSQLGGIDIDLLASLAATVQQNLSGGMAVDGAVTFAASAAHQQAVDLLLDLSQQFSIQTVLTPDAVVHVLGAIALNAGAGFTQLGSLILHTTESLAVNVDDAWQRGLLAEDVVALATQAGFMVDGEIPAGVFTAIVSLAAQTGQITDGALVLNSVLAEEVIAQLTPSTQAVVTQLVSMGCTAAQVQAGGVLHEVIMLLGGQAAVTTSAQHAIAGTLTLAIQQAITVQSQQVANALLSLGCTTDQVQLGTAIIENLLTLSMKGALQFGATVSLANIGNIATITAEALTQPTVTNEVLRTPTVTDERLI